MRPIPWILAALVLTAAGIATTYEGQTTIHPVDRIPSRWPGKKAAVPAIPGAPGEAAPGEGAPGEGQPGAAAPLVRFDIPEGMDLPVSTQARVIAPSPRIVFLAAKADGTFHVRTPATLGKEATESDLPLARIAPLLTRLMKPAPDAPSIQIEPLLAFGAATKWSAIRPVLEAAGEAGCERVHLGALPSEDAAAVGGIPYDLPVFPAADLYREDGGAIDLRVGATGTTFFVIKCPDETMDLRAGKLREKILEWHHGVQEMEGNDYAAANRAWRVVAHPRSTYGALIEGLSLLRELGFRNAGIEASEE